MKKILIINHAGGSPHHGPNMRWYNLGLALKKKNVEVVIITSSFFHKYYAIPEITSEYNSENIDGLEFKWIKTKRYIAGSFFQIFNQFEFIVKIYRFKKEIVKLSPDLVIASSPHPFVFLPAKSIAKSLNIPVAYEVRDLWPEVLVQLNNRLRFHPYVFLLRLIERHAVNTANVLMSVKEGDIDYFESFYRKTIENFKFIPNGLLNEAVSYSAIQPDFTELRDQYKFLIVYTGAISAYYDIEKVLLVAEGLKSFRDIGIVLIGDGNKKAQLATAIVKNESVNVHLLPTRNKSEIFSIIAASDACYLTLTELEINKNGISCNKIYDYMFSSKPIIGHYVSSKYDPIMLSGCGIVAGFGKESLIIDQVLKWKQNPDLAKQIGTAGKQFFEKNYEFSAIAEKLKNELFE